MVHYFSVILVRVALFLTSSAYLLSLSYWFLRSLLISKPASSLLISSCTLTESRKLKLLMDSSIRALSLKLSTKFIALIKIITSLIFCNTIRSIEPFKYWRIDNINLVNLISEVEEMQKNVNEQKSDSIQNYSTPYFFEPLLFPF